MRGDGRDVVPLFLEMMMPRNVAEIGYCGTLGFKEDDWLNGFRERKGLGSVEDRVNQTNFR